MSYVEDLRGALAYTSGIARRVQNLWELHLPDEAEQQVMAHLDAATDSLIAAQSILREHGHEATGGRSVAASAGADKSWRETVYGGKKDSGTVVRRTSKTAVQKPDMASTSAPAMDVAHPWRTEERKPKMEEEPY